MQRVRDRLAGHLMEHRLPSLCAKQALSLFHFSRLKARWAHRQACLCSRKAFRPLRGVARVIDFRGWDHRARARR